MEHSLYQSFDSRVSEGGDLPPPPPKKKKQRRGGVLLPEFLKFVLIYQKKSGFLFQKTP